MREAHSVIDTCTGIRHDKGIHGGRGRRSNWDDAMEGSRPGPVRVPEIVSIDSDWNGKVYATKIVRPVFEETPDEIVVVTVYTYFS